MYKIKQLVASVVNHDRVIADLQAQHQNILEPGALTSAATAARACVGPVGLRCGSCGEAAAIQV